MNYMAALGSQNLGYAIHNVETGQRIQQGMVPVTDDTHISWLGFSEGGIPAFVDDSGMVYILNYYRRVDQGQWTPILDTSAITDSESDFQPHYWPVGLTDEGLTCVKCRVGVSYDLSLLISKCPTEPSRSDTG